ncbi:hypothetical protein, partial [Mesorhizobium sp. M7A.F.Ca.MR.245.00.0.0]|uniref:hypothetical protein n=1 Tax=Mesorhizobium sp. M7A.F.Ca.MR.245.00.0.0 TaxID=2496778 RepID=UPI0019D2F40B
RKPIFEDDMDRCLERDDAIRVIVACLAGPFAESAFEGYLDPRDMAMNASDGNEGSSDYADAKRIYGEFAVPDAAPPRLGADRRSHGPASTRSLVGHRSIGRAFAGQA